jgi:hypothetical protein
LHKAGLQARNGKGLHELANQNVVEVVGHPPKKEQRGDQDEWDNSAPRKQGSIAFLALFSIWDGDRVQHQDSFSELAAM